MLVWSNALMQVAFINEQQNHQIMPSLWKFWISVFMMAAKIMEKHSPCERRPMVKSIPRRKLTNQLLMCCWFGEML